MSETQISMPTKKCVQCHEPKTIHSYSRSEWDREYGSCQVCIKERNKRVAERRKRGLC
jgi:hypothetical protein